MNPLPSIEEKQIMTSIMTQIGALIITANS